MGKDKRGKELGTGISQRKDDKYSARFVTKRGKRLSKNFSKVTEARKWLADAKYEDEHNVIGSNMLVNNWFDYWINEIKAGTVRYNTIRNYTERYNHNIKDIIGFMSICDVRPMHCQSILNIMFEKGYAFGTMKQTRITMCTLFDSALENGLVTSNPVSKAVKCKFKETKERRVLTIDEQKRFIEYAKGTLHYDAFCFILQTGVRVGEMMGLKWQDIDFRTGVIQINRTLQYRKVENRFVFGEPKTDAGKRNIPLTEECRTILLNRKRVKKSITNIEYADLVFYNDKGLPTKSTTYDSALIKIALGMKDIESFSMHTLRHTFATRCIEAGIKPKILQNMLGHSSISITMDLYVHATEDEKQKEMEKFAQYVNNMV